MQAVLRSRSITAASFSTSIVSAYSMRLNNNKDKFKILIAKINAFTTPKIRFRLNRLQF